METLKEEITVTLSPTDWWDNLETQWKKAYNEAMFGKGPVEDALSEEEIKELYKCPNFRFVGPRAPYPNLSFELTNLSGLEAMIQAELISVTHHQVYSVEPITQLYKINSLFVNDNQILSLDGIEKLWQLKTLVASNNEIKGLQALSKLKQLETLQIANNRIDSFEGLNADSTAELKQFVGLPNKVAQTEIDRIQNDLRIRVLRG